MWALIDTFISTWYIWAFVTVVFVYYLFLPNIKGYFGEKFVVFFLSRLNPSKYKIINNIMLQTTIGTSQIDHVVVSIMVYL